MYRRLTVLPTDEDLLKCITWVKDLRMRTPGKGMPYFAYRLLTWEGQQSFGQHWPMEVAFNYLGQHQGSALTERLLQPVNGTGQSVNSRSDIGPNVPRFALIEISAAVIQGSLSLSFSYNRHMKRQNSIRRWAADCRDLIRGAISSLKACGPERSLSNFPLLPLSYSGLGKLKQNLLHVGISSLDEVEDIYPCSPMQEGILLSQLKDVDTYSYRSIFEIRSRQGDRAIDLRQLESAWQDVIQRHPALRTVFIDSIHESSLMDQVVFKSVKGHTLVYEAGDLDARKALSKIAVLNFQDGQPPHRLALCKTSSGRLFCRFDISNAISDGSSMPIILRDLSRAYMNMGPDSPSPLYSEFIAHIQSVPKEKGRSYWREYLSGAEPCQFPSLLAGTRSEKKLGSQILVLKRTLEIQEFCKTAAVTASNLLQLVWALVLRCYTGSDDVCFGYPSSGRDVPVKGIQDAVGAFINMLVFRIDLKRDLFVEDALKRTQQDFVRSMEHQSVSLAEMQHELGLSETSLFNTVFTFQRRRGMEEDSLSALSFDSFDSHDPSEYKLAVNVEMSDQLTEVHFSYWLDYLSKEHVEYVADVFEHVLYELVRSSPGLRISDINFFGPLSSLKVCEWNHMATEKVEKCIHEMIEEQALRQPLSTQAVEGWDASFTYQELNTLSNRLASRLQEQGVGPEVYVPLCFEKSAWAVLAQLSVMKAGGAFVSLDPSHPEDRLRSLIDDVGAHLVLSSANQYDKISRISKATIIVDRDTVNNLPHRPISASAKPSNAAYIIFTSGSTGKPKGTVIEHAAYCTSALAHGEAFHIDSSSRTFQFASYTFDASIMEILTTLIMGGCVCVPSDEERMSDLPRVICRMKANWLFLTPSVANTLKPEQMSSIKVLVLGGEKLSPSHIEKWQSLCLIDGYGPTECSAICAGSTKVNLNGEVLDTEPLTIGKALGGRSWIVDSRETNRLVPVGAIGELLVEGPTVARGYLNDEKKSREVFIQDPQWTKQNGLRGLFKQGERMYRTGDLVRYNPDGTLFYVSRMDMQIKLNGQRIELGEIEYHCGRYLPEHTQVAVDLVGTGKSAAEKLAMFFKVPISDEAHGTDRSTDPDRLLLPMNETHQDMVMTLEKSLSGVLPACMIPQLFFPVSNLPWMSSGKLDRKKLHAEVQELSRESLKSYSLSNSAKRESPRDKMEHTLQSLWEVILSVPSSSIGIDDSFFRLGGDSLAAMKLAGLASSRGISLSVVDIFRCPVLKDMAVKCGSSREREKVTSRLEPFTLLKTTEPIDQFIDEVSIQCRIDKREVSDIYPCSPLQEGLITLSIKQPGAYVAQNVLRLSKTVDVPKFKAAWQQLVEEFDTLRTRIVHTASANFLQVVLKGQAIVWHSAESLEELAEETTRLPDHEGGSLTRYTIVQGKEPSAYYFVWSIHHALYDGWGLSIILKRVEDIYFDRSSSRHTTSYATFIDYLQQRDVSASDKFWTSYLSDVSPVSFPQEASRPLTSRESNMKTFCGTAEISQGTFSLNQTKPNLIRAAWALVLANRTQSSDVCFGETLNGRNIDVSGITELAGPILTTVPTRIQVNTQSKVTEYLAEIQRISTEIMVHQHSGLQHIRRLSGDASRACDFQNLLIVQMAESDSNDELWEVQDSGKMNSFFTYPLVLECKVSDFRIECNIHYNEKVITGWQVERLLQQFAHVLRQLSAVTESDCRGLDKIDMVSPEDKEQISRWNKRRPRCIDQCIHEVFQQRCLSQPRAQAVCAWDGELTYSELSGYASRIAGYLKSLGVAPEVFVPLCLDKSVWTIVAMMGVLIAGGAIVPLDPTHPLTRHREIFEELDVSIILYSPNHSQRYSGIVQHAVQVDEGMIKGLQPTSGHSLNANSATSFNAAYAIFTSGSTGRPKGITIEHRAFISSSMAYAPAMHMKSTCRVLQFASLSFDAAILEILSALTIGACVCVPSEEERLRDLSGAICRMNVSWALLTPSVVNLIDPPMVPCMKVLVCGGEPMTPEVISRWAGHVELVNAYGPTETSICATTNAKVSSEQPSCLGYGISSTLTWVLDPGDHDQLCPLGTIGELALEGPTLARGYINDVPKTAAAFVGDPAWAAAFPSPSSAPRKIHKTGDLVRYNPDGSLEYIGRKDNQVKLHGQRMDLGEIENRLETDPRVRHVIVLMPKTGLFQERLISVLSMDSLSAEYSGLSGVCELVKKDAKVDAELVEIRDRLSAHLPSYMLPKAWAVVKDLPMLVSGKLDRNKVKGWVEDISEESYQHIVDAVGKEECSVETTGVVSLLQEIWAQVLNIPLEKVKPNQSFISLGKYFQDFRKVSGADCDSGGDSITAMAVVSRGRRQRMKLSLHDILRCESIIQLARTVEPGLVSAVQHEERAEEPFTLSPVQQLYFQAAKGYQGRSRFNQSFTIRLSRYIDTDSLESAIENVVKQHSMLRARFHMDKNGEWEQRVTSVST
jgi:amino acid adenylation domain-containing protein/non-ribosomal peptide synthase protein (TIGR01720 family)